MENVLEIQWPPFTGNPDESLLTVRWDGGSTVFSRTDPTCSHIQLDENSTFSLTFSLATDEIIYDYPVAAFKYVRPDGNIAGSLVLLKSDSWRNSVQDREQIFSCTAGGNQLFFIVQPGQETGILVVGTLDPRPRQQIESYSDPMVNGVS